MAAIISRITRENRARKERMGKEVSIAKCTYHLEEFPERFVPAKHNKYLKNRNIFLAVERMNARVQEQFQKRIQGEMDIRQSSTTGTKMDPDMGRDCAWWRTFCCECFVIRQSLQETREAPTAGRTSSSGSLIILVILHLIFGPQAWHSKNVWTCNFQLLTELDSIKSLNFTRIT